MHAVSFLFSAFTARFVCSPYTDWNIGIVVRTGKTGHGVFHLQMTFFISATYSKPIIDY